MSRFFKVTLIVCAFPFIIYVGFNNVLSTDKKDPSISMDTSEEIDKSSNNEELSNDTKSTSNNMKEDRDNAKDISKQITNNSKSNKDTSSSVASDSKDKSSNLLNIDDWKFSFTNDLKISEKDYTLLVLSDKASALVSVDFKGKNACVDLLEDSSSITSKSYNTDNYIDISTYEDYSIEDIYDIKEKFESAPISSKYGIAKDILNNCDTNITDSDLISVALNFLQ